jgi:transposase
VNKPVFEQLRVLFARESGAGRTRHIVLVLDNAGWHGPEGLERPDGMTLVFLPPYSPELQPAERVWRLLDEAVVNRHFAPLTAPDAALGARCRHLGPETIRPHTAFHWWPNTLTPN